MKTVEETRRELFYAWADKAGLPHSMLTCGEWAAFNAALDAIEIELPSCFETFGEYSQEAARIATESCAEAIESTNLGIKVK